MKFYKDVIFLSILLLIVVLSFQFYIFKGKNLFGIAGRQAQVWQTQILSHLPLKTGPDLRPDDGPIDLRLDTSVGNYRLGQALPVLVTLRNSSQHFVLVFNRYGVYSPVTFEAFDAQGKEVPRRPARQYDFSVDKDFYWLKAGQSVQGKADLNQVFHFSQPGFYKIRAVYGGFRRERPRSNEFSFELKSTE